MSDVDNTNAYMVINLGEEGGRHQWLTHDEAVEWLNQLRDDWSWLSQVGVPQAHIAWKTIIRNKLQPVINSLDQAAVFRSQGQTKNAEDHVESARASLESLFGEYPWLLPNNTQRLYVEKLRDEGKQAKAALIVCYWVGVDLNGAPIRDVVDALIDRELSDRGIKDRVVNESAALKKLAGEMQTTLSQLQESKNTQAVRFDELLKQRKEQGKLEATAFATDQTQREEEWKQHFSETKIELDRLRETYDKHMALAAPVEYWDGKRKKHGWWALGSFIATTLAMVSAALFLHSELQMIGQAVTASKTATSAAIQTSGVSAIKTVADSATAWHLGSFLLMATLSFWFIRLLVRIFLSNLHLENDAAERVTMAKTYLALIRNEDLPRGENISAVLAALFRPTGDGIVKDEGIPPSALELFTKLGR